MVVRPHVGTLGEKPLHAALKQWYAVDDDLIEEPVDGFVVDLVRQGLLIEVQTKSFSSMKRKLGKLLTRHSVRLVHPIAAEKWILKLDDDGNEGPRRKSPKHGVAHDVFAELVSFPALVAHPGLTLEILLTREEELRRFDGRLGRRRGGWVIVERRLLEVVGRLVVESPEDLAALLPDDTPPEFTTADLAHLLRRPRRLARQMAYCLQRAGATERVGKNGNSIVYRRTSAHT